MFPWQERLQVAEIAVANARANPSRASIFVDKSIALEMLMHEDNLTMVLAPYLHGNRYTCRMTLNLATYCQNAIVIHQLLVMKQPAL